MATFNGGSPACTNYTAGTFTDWRLPNIKEQLSLVDYSQFNPPFPSGHPFVSVQSSFYWSSSSFATDPTGAWGVHMFTGDGSPASKANVDFVWAVRAGQ